MCEYQCQASHTAPSRTYEAPPLQSSQSSYPYTRACWAPPLFVLSLTKAKAMSYIEPTQNGVSRHIHALTGGDETAFNHYQEQDAACMLAHVRTYRLSSSSPLGALRMNQNFCRA